MKSGPTVIDQLFDAATDVEAIGHCRETYMKSFDPQRDTVFVFRGTEFVWGCGPEATAFYDANPSFPKLA
jgi:hypothetical protein